ncbi:MAG TPA: AAA family ATPase [Candidatus Nitrosopolaris rasttigaisensis]|nr:AAA family ATPase [Candidatus Nitrosopolaris rasttigaisensis]
MEVFVNRKDELRLIDDSFNALLDKKRLLRTPIIEIQGVGGIGKTSLLRQVERQCYDTNLPHIWLDVSQSPSCVAHEIITQVKKYIQEDKVFLEQSPVHATKVLLKHGPVVMLLDSVDRANEEQLGMIEILLRDLVDDGKLLVVLTSRRALPFQQERSVARKLTTLSLTPLDRENCEFYLNNLGCQIEPEVRNIIFEWTRGYPLAMHVMAQAISSGLDPRTQRGQKDILSLLTNQVINENVLARIKPQERVRHFSALQLFSVPRRFNLVIMQDLIEAFTPELKRESHLAYFSLPKEVNEATDVLNWSMLRAGFSVDEPVRNIFLLLLKIEQLQRYFAVHDFLADTNLRLAKQFSGSDRVRYIRECLYHTASNTSSPLLSELLAQALQIILQEPPETFLQFLEEFSQDEELKEILGNNTNIVLSLIEDQVENSTWDTAKELINQTLLQRSWDTIKELINQTLLQYGFVDLTSFPGILVPRVDRLLTRYMQEYPDRDLEYNVSSHSLQLRVWPVVWNIKGLLTSIVSGVENVNYSRNSQKVYSQVEELIDKIYSLLEFRVVRKQDFETLRVFLTETGTAFENLRLPNPLPVFIIPHRDIPNTRLELVRLSLITDLKMRIAVLIAFCEKGELTIAKERISRMLHNVYALDIVVLTQEDLLEVSMAKDPSKVLRHLVLSQINLAIIAPYTTAGPTPAYFFFGREHELREICENINRASYIITGGRRIGKTSLTSCLDQKHLPAYGFRTIYHDCSITPNYEAFLSATVLRSSSQGSFTFRDLLLSQAENEFLVLLLDEADKLVLEDRKHQWRLFNTLRALVNARRIQVVLSGERLLRETLRDSSSPLYNFGVEMLIGRLDEHAVEQLVTQPMKQLEIELVDEKAIVADIWNFSSGHPNIVQRLCHRLIESLKNGHHSITSDDVRQIVEDPQFQRKDFLETYWEQSTLLERILSLLLAQINQQPYTLRDVRRILDKRLGLISPHGRKPSGIEVDAALNRLVDLRSILASTSQGYIFAVNAFPLVVSRPNIVTIDDLFDVYTEAYHRHGDVLYEEVILRDLRQ